MIIDSIIANNEVDLIKLRIDLLKNKVDHFYIVDSDTTHSGNPKTRVFEEHFGHLENVTIVYCDISEGKTSLDREIIQRNFSKTCVTHPWDILICSDVDEIPNIDSILKYKDENPKDRLACCVQKMSCYFINNVVTYPENHKNWQGSIVMFKPVEESCQELRDLRFGHRIPNIQEGGFHWSYLGGVKDIIFKLKTFHHVEYSTDYYTNESRIEKAIQNNTDLFGRDFSYQKEPISNFPKQVLNYKKFIL
jgi:hypothetical protein